MSTRSARNRSTTADVARVNDLTADEIEAIAQAWIGHWIDTFDKKHRSAFEPLAGVGCGEAPKWAQRLQNLRPPRSKGNTGTLTHPLYLDLPSKFAELARLKARAEYRAVMQERARRKRRLRDSWRDAWNGEPTEREKHYALRAIESSLPLPKKAERAVEHLRGWKVWNKGRPPARVTRWRWASGVITKRDIHQDILRTHAQAGGK
jgi:hypothetical protein